VSCIAFSFDRFTLMNDEPFRSQSSRSRHAAKNRPHVEPVGSGLVSCDRGPLVAPAFAGCDVCQSIGASAGLASVACPSWENQAAQGADPFDDELPGG
jgi:hypothetical protein